MCTFLEFLSQKSYTSNCTAKRIAREINLYLLNVCGNHSTQKKIQAHVGQVPFLTWTLIYLSNGSEAALFWAVQLRARTAQPI
jgi:hypothetical protein